MQKLGCLIMLAACSMCVMAAQAAPVTLQFNGVVDSSGEFSLPVGTGLSGQLSYDSSTLPSSCVESSEVPFCNFPVVSFQLAFVVPGAGALIAHSAVIAATPSDTADHSAPDVFAVSGAGFDDSRILSPGGSIHLVLLGNLMRGLALSDHPDVPVFGGRPSGWIDNTAGYTNPLTFHLTSISAVPEPSVAWLNCLGLAGMVVGVRGQYRKARPSI